MKSLFKGVFWLAALIALVAVVGRMFFFEVVQTTSYSMVPGLFPGDTFLVFTLGLLGPGDSVVCHDPENPGAMVVSRVVGVPGTPISMQNNHLIINGRVIFRSYSGQRVMYEDATGGEVQRFTISFAEEKLAGHLYTVGFVQDVGAEEITPREVEAGFYLLGDNRNRARDSRTLGEIAIKDCIGTPFIVIWPGPDSGDFKFRNRFLKWIH